MIIRGNELKLTKKISSRSQNPMELSHVPFALINNHLLFLVYINVWTSLICRERLFHKTDVLTKSRVYIIQSHLPHTTWRPIADSSGYAQIRQDWPDWRRQFCWTTVSDCIGLYRLKSEVTTSSLVWDIVVFQEEYQMILS